jgi:hypothetical protein
VILTAIIGGSVLVLGLVALLLVTLLSGKKSDQPAEEDDLDIVKVAGRKSHKGGKGSGKFFIPLTPEQEKKVDEAVKHGVEYLKRAQQPSGTWTPFPKSKNHLGYAALPGLTLLECGVSPNDPVVQRAAAYVRQHALQDRETYDLSLSILFLDRLGEIEKKKDDRWLIQSLALRLVAGQTAKGGWGYTCDVLDQAEERRLVSILQELRPKRSMNRLNPVPEFIQLSDTSGMSNRLKRLAMLQDQPGFKGLAPPKQEDNSNTQFAILALWAAQRYDLPLERTLALLVKRFRTSQQLDGHWKYDQGRSVVSIQGTPTMTCAGLLGIAVGHGLGKEGEKAEVGLDDDPAVQAALRHLSNSVEVPLPFGRDIVDLYYLWSLERVAMIYQLKEIKAKGDPQSKNWYVWGMEMIVRKQIKRPGDLKDGGWDTHSYHGSSPPIDTSLALLFLKRANLAKDLTDKLERDRQVAIGRKE